MRGAKQVPTWCVTPLEGETGKWKLVRGENFVSKNGGAIPDEDQNSMPSLAELIAKGKAEFWKNPLVSLQAKSQANQGKAYHPGFQTSLKETRCDRSSVKESRCDGSSLKESGCDGSSLKESGCDGFSQRPITLQMTSHSVDMPQLNPYHSEFLVNGHDTEHGQDYSRKFVVEQESNLNASDPQISASSSPPTGNTAEIGKLCKKYSRKRPVFKSSFRNEELKFKNFSKLDVLNKAKPSGNSSGDGLTSLKGAGDFTGMFKKASGKSVSILSSSLERARALLGKDLGAELINPGCADPSQNSEVMGLLPTASIIPPAVTIPSIKNAESLCFENLTSEVLESQSVPVPHAEKKIRFQTTEGEDPVVVPTCSITRPQSAICGHHTLELFKSHDKSVPQTMNKDMKMFGAAKENHVTVLSSLSQTTSNFEVGTGNPVNVSSLSMQGARNDLGEDTSFTFSELHTRSKSQTINKATAIFQTASGNPVTVLPSSIKKALAIFGKSSTSDLHESDTGSTPQKASIMFQTTPGNPVSVRSLTDKNAKNMTSNEPLETVDHDKPKPMVNTSSEVFQTSTGNCLKTSFAGIKNSETNVQKEKDIQTGKNNNENALSSNNGICRTSLIFQTAAGKPVVVSISSVKRALSILGDDDNLVVNGGNDTTGSFENIIEKSAEALLPSYKRGETILGKDRRDISKGEDGEKKHELQLGCADQPKLCDSDKAAFEFAKIPTKSISVSGETAEESNFVGRKTLSHQSLFHTGTGKPVNISMSGISKAKALLESEGTEASITNKAYETHGSFANVLSGSAFDQSNFLSDRVSTITANCHNICSIGKAESGSSQMQQFTFQTAAGRSVNVSTHAMKRAMDLLGDEANNSTVRMTSLGNAENNTVVSCGPPPLLFQTGAGRSVSVSSAAMKRARNILGEMSDISSAATDQQRSSEGIVNSFADPAGYSNGVVLNKQSVPHPNHASRAISSDMNCGPTKLKRLSADFGNAFAGVSPRTPRHCQDAVSNKENLPYANHVSHVTTEDSFGELILVSGDSRAKKLGKRKVCMSPLAEISNESPICDYDNYLQRPTATPTVHKSLSGSKRGLFRSRRVTPFKQPRRSMFLSPYDKMPKSVGMESSLSVQSFPQGAPCEVKFQFCYPLSKKRKTIQEYFGGPPDHQQALWHLSTEIQSMTADSAQHYSFYVKCGSGYDNFIARNFWKMLLELGADPRNATIEWVENHYKWIVWKLACIERSYARQAAGKFLTVQNVLEELKYRYEREVNRGHRSPLKKIVEGDAVAASTMVLCVSAIRVWPHQEHNEPSPIKDSMEVLKESENHISNGISKPSGDNWGKIELTDGWYCLNAILDEPLCKQLLQRKLFIGQKLRICGASLHGWVGPLSPLEASRTVSLILHINGTYRAHWAERLSFCRGLPVPLAFRSIKEGGGPVPRTLVGITRIYPTLYKERLANRAYIIRSERAEDKTLHVYNERRTHIVEDVMLKAEKEHFHSSLDSNKDEGAHLYRVLENACEPELIMADMTSAQLAAFAAYKSKRELFSQAIRQASIEKHIQKALENADLDSRKVTPFMKVRIVGLTHKCLTKIKEKGEKRGLLEQEGLVTIWQPTENHVFNLEEGAIYCVSGLVPLGGKSGDSYSQNILQFQANRSTVWHRIPISVCHNFEFVYNPRSAVQLSDLGRVPLHSEFDVAVFVLHIGEPYTYGLRKRQWLFTSDGSVELESGNKQSEIILAIDFSLPCDSFIALDHSLVGSTVGLCNLVKQKRDQKNSLCVAEMTEISTHSVNFNATNFCHLKAAAELTNKWAKVSMHAVENLLERVSNIIENAT
ncbi:protein BREAST CANCER SUSCEPTIBILITY 2 homolog B isoform X2 [Cryptomeria japonica]|uniref:protein BREAST CANCER SUSCEPTIBILITY 2 homolog B isoform X2 n=1 Tax=Cryptomeria japonica TaxID=3369 RepID=UPI0027D9D341|nr:protein BREAST CANCER SUSCEPTIBILITY 2 homolog B isoform X2 [Cryptomeria japonica]